MVRTPHARVLTLTSWPSWCASQCLRLPIAFYHRLNSEIDLIKFVEIVMMDINIKLALIKFDN